MDYLWIILGVILAFVSIVLIYIIPAVYKFINQSRYVYHPLKEIMATPSELDLDFEDIIFRTSDGVDLSGWYLPAKSSNKVILVLHGNGGNISTRLTFIDYFSRMLGLSTFIIDYRGYGISKGVTTEFIRTCFWITSL